MEARGVSLSMDGSPHVRLGVVLPAYRVAGPLRELLASLSAQRFTAWRCVAVDDGSQDATGTVLDEAVRADGRIAVVHQRNAGVSQARNRALARLAEDYVCFLDGDDLIAPTWLETFARLAAETRADLVRLRKTNWPEHRPLPMPTPNQGVACFAEPDFDRRYRWLFALFIRDAWPVLTCIRREALAGVRFPAGIPVNEDTVFFLRLLPHIRTLAQGDFAGYIYRLRAGSALRSRRKGAAVTCILDAMAAVWAETRALPLSGKTRAGMAKRLSTFCWGTFLDWAVDASQATPAECSAVREALRRMKAQDFWRPCAVYGKYAGTNAVPFWGFLRFGAVLPIQCFARAIVLTRRLRAMLRHE